MPCIYTSWFFSARSKAQQYQDAEELDKLEMREAFEADDAKNRLETPSLGKLLLDPDPSQLPFMKICLFT